MTDRIQGGVKAGSTGVSIDVVLRTAADGTETTGVAFGSATAYYWRQGGAPVAIALAALTNLTDAWSSGGWKQADAANMPGSYRLDVPDAAFAAGADWVEVNVKVSGSFVYKERFTLTTNVVQTGDAYATGVANAALLATIAGYIDTEVASIVSELAKVPKSDGAVSLNATVLAAVADALLNRDMAAGADTGSASVRTARQALRVLRNKWSISGTTLTVTKEDDTTDSWTSELTAASGVNPVTGSDPA